MRVLYNGGAPARVRPLELRVMERIHPVRAKPRRYPPEKRQFLSRYMSQLERLWLIKKDVRTDWVSAPLVVPEKPPAYSRLTVEYRAVNAATVKNTWFMPHINAAVQDLRIAAVFAGINFTSGYRQLPMHSDSQHVHSFMTSDEIMKPTSTNQGGCNSAANFQERVEPCVQELRNNLLAMLDDFALHRKTKSGLFDALACFLQLCSDHCVVVSHPNYTFLIKG